MLGPATSSVIAAIQNLPAAPVLEGCNKQQGDRKYPNFYADAGQRTRGRGDWRVDFVEA